jgi:ubiquinone/menaquinone biosynthesis C-methylase UbiE
VTSLKTVYDDSAAAWGAGPDRVFGALAGALLSSGPLWQGLEVVDIGAGTGTATRRLLAAGARVVPVDASAEMLAVARGLGACSPVVGDARRLPLRTDSADAAVLGFVLNHLHRPADALREATRVVHAGGSVLASTWARDNEQPVREVVQEALRQRGWQVPDWYTVLKDSTTPLSDTTAALGLLAAEAGLVDVVTEQVEVAVPASAHDQLEWRLGMPHTAPFVATLTCTEQSDLWAELTTADLPPLTCAVIHLVGRVA